MAETKYGKLKLKELVVDGKFVPRVVLTGEKHGDGANFSMVYNCITEPWVMRSDPHAHPFDQFLCFMGGNPTDVGDFGAEVELTVGDEGEKLIIDTTTIVYIPKGLMHCPLNFKRIDKPIIFIDIYLAPSYAKTAASE